jgi:hypothetical protein
MTEVVAPEETLWEYWWHVSRSILDRHLPTGYAAPSISDGRGDDTPSVSAVRDGLASTST